jgi:3'(2'), 5'-bisphosphate nucleotidase
MTFPHPLLEGVLAIARQAGESILPFWRVGVEVTAKADDSPVTAADLAAHQVIVAGLARLAPHIPILSEEDCDVPLSVREGWTQWWLVDPLDGTKEFIAGTEEFTVNIALVVGGEVVFGVVTMPVTGRAWWGGAGLGAWCQAADSAPAPIETQAAPPAGQPFTVVASRRHSSPQQQALLAGLENAVGPLSLTSIGSSLKFCLVAEGVAHCYPRLAPTSQWDTAAAQGVLEGAGGEVVDTQGQPFRYPVQESLLNTHFLALPKRAPWRAALLGLCKA